MAYQVTVEEHPTYLHVIGAGTRTEENLRCFLIDAHRASVERKRDLLLLELNFSGRSLNLGSVYSVISERSSEGSKYKRIAYVDASHERAPEESEFAELAAHKQGVNVRLFQSIAEAKRWLEGDNFAA